MEDLKSSNSIIGEKNISFQIDLQNIKYSEYK